MDSYTTCGREVTIFITFVDVITFVDIITFVDVTTGLVIQSHFLICDGTPFISSFFLVNTTFICYIIFSGIPQLPLTKYIHITVSVPFIMLNHGKKVIPNNTPVTKCVDFLLYL